MEQEIRDKLNGTISIVDNAYRTKNYMVTQHIEIEDDEDEGTHLCSYDTYYLRTPERDKAYEKEYGMRMNVDGRRIRMYFDQFRSIVRQALNSGRLLASAAKIKNFNRRPASVLSGDFIKSKNNSFKW